MAEDIHVLCVDDERDVLELGKTLLETRNEFSVDTALSASAALEILSRKTYDAIVSDYKMEGMDGIEFLKKVRDMDKTVPFILFTGRGREEVVIEALNSGADFYLQKGGATDAAYTELGHVIRQTVRMRRTRLTLAGQEERYHDILNTSDLIQTVEPDGRFLFVNRKLLDVLGYLDNEIRNLTLFDIVDDDCIGNFRQTFLEIISGGNAGIIKTVFRTRAGRRIYVEGMAGCRMAAGKCQHVRLILRDVTARKEAEKGLIESEHKFSTIFENSPYPIAITGVADRKFINVNKAFLNVSGYHGMEILGKSPAEIGLFSEADAEMLHSRIAQGGKIENIPLVLIVKGGRPIHVQLSAMPITIHDQPAIVTMIAETTRLRRVEEELLLRNRMLAEMEKEIRANYEELLRNEQALIDSERRYRSLFENMVDALAYGKVIYDDSGNPDDFICLETNTAFSGLTGLTGVTGKRVTEVIPGIRKMNPELFEIFFRVARSGTPEKFEFYFKPRKKWGNVTVYCPKKDYFIAIFNDVTDRKLTEEALRKSEEIFRNIFSGSALGMALSLPDFRFVLINPAMTAMLGYDEDELRSMSFEDITHPDDLAVDRERIGDLAAGTIPVYSTEKRYIRKDSSILWGSLKVTTIRNLQGEIVYYLAQIEDITPRKQAEEALKKSEDMLAQVMNGVPTFLASLDKEMRFIYSNKPMAAFFGHSEDEMIGKRAGEFLPGETYATLEPLFRKVLGGEEVTFEYPAPGRDGCPHVLETRLVPQVRGHQVIGIFAAVNDITEHKQMEAALRESEMRFHAMFENHGSVMLLIEAETGRIMDANRAAETYYGWTQQQFCALYIQDINALPPEVVAAEMAKAAAAKPGAFIFPHRAANGEIRTVEVYSSPIAMKGKTVLFSIIHDITERRRAEDALRQANKKLNLLSGITRHDINNKLLALDGFIEILNQKISDPTYEILFSRITDASRQISAMIRFTREYEKVGVNAPVWQDLKDLVNDAGKTAIPQQVTLMNDLPAGAEVFADPLIIKVFFNLIDNALRHGGRITMIRFSLETRNGTAIIVCEDDGNGVPQEQKERIFERGFGKNTGFGLFISREILDITGLTIRETGEPDKGARFEITVPEIQFRFTGTGSPCNR